MRLTEECPETKGKDAEAGYSVDYLEITGGNFIAKSVGGDTEDIPPMDRADKNSENPGSGIKVIPRTPL